MQLQLKGTFFFEAVGPAAILTLIWHTRAFPTSHPFTKKHRIGDGSKAVPSKYGSEPIILASFGIFMKKMNF
jgi:hypothetical protein